MEMTKRPYELLIRWDEKTGVMKGSHVKWVYTGTDEDGEQVVNVSKAKPLDLGRGEGYPLDGILTTAEIEALSLYEIEKRERLDAEEARDAADHSRKQAELAKESAESAKAMAEQERSAAVAAKEAIEVEKNNVAKERDNIRVTAEALEQEIAALRESKEPVSDSA